jgi:hypothetical protein
MRDFNDLLLKLDLDLSGSYETGFLSDDSNAQQWPIPNVLGVASADSP